MALVVEKDLGSNSKQKNFKKRFRPGDVHGGLNKSLSNKKHGGHCFNTGNHPGGTKGCSHYGGHHELCFL